MKERRVLIIVGDGMSDRCLPELGGKTPLEYADTPNMDTLARKGMCGLRSPYKPGLAVESDVANLILLGYDPKKYYLGRGVFEALGLGISLKEVDLAFRVNLATVRDGIIVDRRAGRFDWDKKPIAEVLNSIKVEGIEVRFHPGVEHRGVLVFSGPGLSRQVTGNDPHKVGVPPKKVEPKANDRSSMWTAEVINKYLLAAEKKLRDLDINRERERKGLLPANYLLIRGAGMFSSLPSFEETYGMRGALICGFPLVRGVGIAVGLGAIDVEGATGTTKTNYLGKAKAVVKTLEEHDFVYLHFKAPDSASHDGNHELKIEVIEKIDEAIGLILNNISIDETVICVTSDHATPLSVRDHTGDLVPFVLYSSDLPSSGIDGFCERSVIKSGCGILGSMDILPLLRNLARSPKFAEF